MVAWDRGLRARAILTPASWSEVFTAARLNDGETYPYGFGWTIDTIAGQPVHTHGGSWQGFKAYIARYLGPDLTIIVLANLFEADAARFVDGIAAIIDPLLVRPAQVSASLRKNGPIKASSIPGKCPAGTGSHRSSWIWVAGATAMGSR